MLRERLRTDTTRRLHRTRYLHRGAIAVALVACYAAGLATVWFMRPAPRPHETVVIEAPHDAPNPPPESSPRSPGQLEMDAEMADGSERARLFMEAARAFARNTDWDAAVRCYRNALDASDGKLAIDPKNDDWLMVTLKLSRKQEQSHANE
jgi:hypothetical protein